VELIKHLENSNIVRKFDVIDCKIFKDVFFIKVRVEIIDNSLLFIKEYSDKMSRKYSYNL